MRRDILAYVSAFALGIYLGEMFYSIFFVGLTLVVSILFFASRKKYWKKESQKKGVGGRWEQNCERNHVDKKNIILVSFILFGIITVSLYMYRIHSDYNSNLVGKENFFTARVSMVEIENDEYYIVQKITCEIQRVNDDDVALSHNTLVNVYTEKEVGGGAESNSVPESVFIDGRNSSSMPEDILTDNIKSGDIITFTGILELPSERSNPSVFDYRLYLRGEGISTIINADAVHVIGCDENLLDAINNQVSVIKSRFIGSFSENSDAVNLVSGVVFGNYEEMSDTTVETFRENGTAHILAVSGLHVGLLFLLYKKIIGVNSTWKIIFFSTTLFFFVALSSWSVSAIRASSMIVVSLIGAKVSRRYDMQTATALIAFAVLISNPFKLYSLSFLMSFLAVLSIGIISRFFSRVAKFNQTLSVVIGVQIGMIPIIAYSFNYISLNSIIVNIPIVFLLSILMPIALLGVILSVLNIHVSAIYSFLEAVAQMMIWLNEKMYFGGGFLIETISGNVTIVLLIYAFIFIFFSEEFYIWVKRRDYRQIYKVVVVVLGFAFFFYIKSYSPFERCDIVFVDVGQGDCIHVISKDNTMGDVFDSVLRSDEKNILIDGGGNVRYNVGENVLKPYLMKNSISVIDIALVTHMHADHYLGIEQLNEVYDIEEVNLQMQIGDYIDLGNGNYIQTIWPIVKKEEMMNSNFDENENTSVFKVSIDGVKVLLTGDLTEEGERSLIEYYEGTEVLDIDILKISHHGSKYSSCPEFIDATSPMLAVIQVGKNTHGHPHSDVINRLEEQGIPVYRNDLQGAIGIEIDDGTITVHTMK